MPDLWVCNNKRCGFKDRKVQPVVDHILEQRKRTGKAHATKVKVHLFFTERSYGTRWLRDLGPAKGASEKQVPLEATNA